MVVRRAPEHRYMGDHEGGPGSCASKFDGQEPKPRSRYHGPTERVRRLLKIRRVDLVRGQCQHRATSEPFRLWRAAVRHSCGQL